MEAFKNLEAEDLMNKVRSIRDRSHKGFDSFVFYFSGHGNLNSIQGDDGQNVLIDDVVDLFQPNNCPSLQHRPKVKIKKKNQNYV